MKNNLTIAIASGKGGTGKTTIATNLAVTLSKYISEEVGRIQLIDCDVEEPNAHLFLKPVYTERHEVALTIPEVDKAKCIQCGRCSEFCVYNALAFIAGEILVFPELCHGCGGCSFICPAHAISESQRVIGLIEVGEAGELEFLRGELKISSPMAPPIIRQLKDLIKQDGLTIIDAPPGTSCSVVASLYQTDYVILVTEPSPFGLHDLRLAFDVVKTMQIPCGVVINRGGTDGEQRAVEDFCHQEKIPVLLTVPFSKDYASCYAMGGLLVEQFPELRQDLCQLFHKIMKEVGR